MEDKKLSKKLICSICGQKLLREPNISGKPYAVRLSEPIICDICSQHLSSVDDENQSRLQAKSYSNIIKLNEIIATVKSVIKGQNKNIEIISTAIYKNQRIDNVEVKSNIIILGDSGSGKTEIIKILADQFKLPFVIEDATRFTEAGYVGPSTDDMIKDLYMAAGDNITKAQKGILVIDEGDKKEASNDGGRDVAGQNVLFSLLKILEGTKVPITDNYGDTLGYLETSRITIVFIGAFPNLAKIREKRINRMGLIGFNDKESVKEYMNSEYIADDFIKGGFPKEFIGRFDIIAELDELTINVFEDITRNSKKSTFINYVKVLEEKGIKLIYSDDVFCEIAVESLKLNIGARGIKNVVQNMFKDIMLKLLSSDEKYTECLIFKDTVHDSTKYILK